MVFDVGANIGYHTLGAAATGARVYAFEPVPRLRNRLADNLRLNGLERRVVASELALSNRNGSAELYLARRLDDGSHSLIPGVPAHSVECITVQTVRLDDHSAVREAQVFGQGQLDARETLVDAIEARVHPCRQTV